MLNIFRGHRYIDQIKKSKLLLRNVLLDNINYYSFILWFWLGEKRDCYIVYFVFSLFLLFLSISSFYMEKILKNIWL